jgi:hypothetical protein
MSMQYVHIGTMPNPIVNTMGRVFVITETENVPSTLFMNLKPNSNHET